MQAAGEYTTIAVGNLTEALDKLHTAQHTLQGHEAALQQQQTQDRLAQSTQATALSLANDTQGKMEAAQAR